MTFNPNYPGAKAFPGPVVLENTATFHRGIATGSVTGGQPPSVTAPAVPATTVAATNTTGYDVMVYLACGAGVSVTVVAINGVTTGVTCAASTGEGGIYLPANGRIALTYSGGTPTWVWMAV